MVFSRKPKTFYPIYFVHCYRKKGVNSFYAFLETRWFIILKLFITFCELLTTGGKRVLTLLLGLNAILGKHIVVNLCFFLQKSPNW